jgi:hypothetical protein
MSIDQRTKRELTDARKNIIAQLDKLEFRVSGNAGAWRLRGPRDAGDVYDELRTELREINQLLGNEEGEESEAEISDFVSPSQITDYSKVAPSINAKLWAALMLLMLVVSLLFGVAHALADS